MKNVWLILFCLTVSLHSFSQDDDDEINLEIENDTSNYVRYKSIIFVNALNGLVLRPRLSVEYFVKKRLSVDLEGGIILPFAGFQNLVAPFLHEDSYLTSGYYGAISFNKYGLQRPDKFIGIKIYFKKLGYNNKVWNNGYAKEITPPDSTNKSFEYVTSNHRIQIGATFMLGGFKTIKKNFIFHFFYGGGLLYQTGTRTFHQKNYDNSLRFLSKTLPFEEEVDKIYPIINIGFKIGIGVGKTEYDNVKLVKMD
ncbi:MAG: hypothetical protein JKY15_06755 [Deltaproteobacteria bacterium]|nr:hypothetical protein [Deltaproteobacteria bacterium]